MARTLAAVLNESNPNKIADALKDAKAGVALSLIPGFCTGAVAADTLTLPSDLKALAALSVRATAAGTPGVKVLDPAGTPAAGEFGITPTGDILFAAADAVTAAEVVYVAVEGEVITETLAVVASQALLVQGRKGVLLLGATVLVGVTLGPIPTVIARGSAPGPAETCFTNDGMALFFNMADVVAGSVSVTYVLTPGTGGSTSVRGQLLSTASNL